jgi:hypothetical protein
LDERFRFGRSRQGPLASLEDFDLAPISLDAAKPRLLDPQPRPSLLEDESVGQRRLVWRFPSSSSSPLDEQDHIRDAAGQFSYFYGVAGPNPTGPPQVLNGRIDVDFEHAGRMRDIADSAE